MIGDDDFDNRIGGFDEMEARGKFPPRTMSAKKTGHGPKCPACGSRLSKVFDTRSFNDGSVKRRRECLDTKCAQRYSTWESTTSPVGVSTNKFELPEADRRRINQIALMAARLDTTYNGNK